ncbi:MAG: hypothetical protein HYU46_08370 [Deltaproteobacteria bacterium]|nr:hypothetical protein [Deltaproteobacteria bacterium]
MVRNDLGGDLKAAAFGADEDRDGFALVKGSLGPRKTMPLKVSLPVICSSFELRIRYGVD